MVSSEVVEGFKLPKKRNPEEKKWERDTSKTITRKKNSNRYKTVESQWIEGNDRYQIKINQSIPSSDIILYFFSLKNLVEIRNWRKVEQFSFEH